jgi:hypothetical protein
VERLALALGACATLTTLVGWCVALAPAHPPEPAPGTAAWQVVERPGGSFAVPPAGTGWDVVGEDEVIYYADRRGEPAVLVTGPAVLDEGYCEEVAGPSNRAFAGVTGPVRGGVRGVNGRLARAWARAVAGGAQRTAVRPERAELADGAPAVRSRLVVRVPPGPCRPARAAIDLVSARGGAGVVTLVLVRDLTPEGLAQADAELIVAALRPR